MRRVLVALLIAVACLPGPAQAAARRVALVVGNGAYQHTLPLANPPNDARAVARALAKLGFEVVEAVDRDQAGMRATLAQFARQLEGAEAGLFFYAGHGLQVQGRNFLVPVDAVLEREADLYLQALALDDVMRLMEAAVPVRLVILDACRNNPLTRSLARAMGTTRSAAIGSGLARIDAAAGTLIAFATAPGEVALDGKGQNSPFTQALLEHIDEPGLEARQVLTRVRRGVIGATNGQQLPWDSSSLTGDFFFGLEVRPSAPALSEPSAPAALPQSALELTLWQSAEKYQTRATYEDYTTRFCPGGAFCAAAAEALLRLEVTTAPAARERPTATTPGSATGGAMPAPDPAAELPTEVEPEPNDIFGQASRVAATGPFRGTIQPRGDADWLRFTVDRQGELRIVTVRVPTELDLSLRVWNADKGVLTDWFAPRTAGGTLEAMVDLPALGDYLLEVRDGGDSAASPEAYALGLAFTPSPDQREPNDAFGAARPLALGGSAVATILPRGDADWFALDAPDQGELTVEVPDPPDNLDIVLRLWTMDKGVLTDWYAPLKVGGPTRAVADLPVAGRYMLEVRDGSDDARSVRPFTVRAHFVATGDAGEPNTSFGTAKSLPLGEPVRATILPKGDSDWYAVELPDQGELTVRVTEVAKDLDIVLRAWTADKGALTDWYAPLAPGGDTVAVIDIPTPGRWLLEVRDGGDSARSPVPYSLRTDFRPTGDVAEPNDVFGTAKLLPPGTSAHAAILPRGDADWYAIDVSDQGELTVEVPNPPASLDVVLRVWTADKGVLTDWYSPLAVGGPTRAVADLPVAGRYMLEVHDGGDSARSVEPFTITSYFAATGDAGEPNNVFGAATPLPLGAPVRASILPKGDSDWYQLQVPRRGRLRLRVDDPPKELDVVVRLWNADKGVVFDWLSPTAVGGALDAYVDLPAAGEYRLEVRDGGDNARSPAPYSLRVDLAAS